MYRKHNRVQLNCDDPSLTIQSAKQECDINYILKKHAQTGIIDHVKSNPGNYGDFISAPDFHSAMNQLQEAKESFMLLPSDIRLQFDNNAADFLEFAQDANNLPEMVEMGLISPGIKSPPKEAELPHQKTDVNPPPKPSKSSEK